MQLGDGWSERFPQDDPRNAVVQRFSELELLSADEMAMGTGNKIGAVLARSQLGVPSCRCMQEALHGALPGAAQEVCAG